MKSIFFFSFALFCCLFSMAQSPIPTNALQLWLRGDDGITKDVNNKISAWVDQSSNGRMAAQSNPNKQPVWVNNVINGHAVVRFASVVEDLLETNYKGPNTGAVTIFVVAAGANISSVVRFQNNVAASTGFLIYGYTHFGANNGFCMTNDGGELNGINCGFYQNSQLHIGTARWKANTVNGMQTFLDGNLLAQRNSSNSILPNDTLTIGSGNGSGGATDENTEGDIAEIIIYDRALTDAERIQVETYLNIKYRVTNNLASSLPGSGNAIIFNGSTQSLNVPNATAINFGTNDFSLAFWYNSANNGRAEIIFEKRDDNCGDGQNWSVRKAADQVYLEINVPGPTSDVVTIPNAGDGKWHHIVFTRTATQLSGFKDGVLIATTSAPAQNVNNSAPIQIATGPCSPFFPGGNGFFTGSLDEIQLWNAALSQAQIRDRMCKKITSADPLYGNLMAYYNFDEATGATVFDGTINTNNGTLINTPTRNVSGAHIGNTSTHSYAGGASTAALIHPTRGDALTATLSSGGADGVQVYCVTENPNNTTGQTILDGNNSYFGVFPINGTATQYTATYNYSGIGLNASPENKLALYKRNDNAAAQWTKLGAVLDSNANTLTATGQNTEYMIGLNDQQQVLKPGSGNAINFDGVDDYVEVVNVEPINFGTNENFSVETWIKIPSALAPNETTTTVKTPAIIEKWEDDVSPYPFVIRYRNHNTLNDPSLQGTIEAARYDGINNPVANSGIKLNDDKYHHIAFVKNGNSLLLFVDGILTSTTLDNTVSTTKNTNRLLIGNSSISTPARPFFGNIDEIKIWNIALTQSQIRDRMCHKITSSDPLYGNLVAYYNFDESTGTTAFDGTVNANNGTLTNSPARVTSGAAIGNASSQDYVNATKTASITHANGESFTVTSTSGNPDGIQVYRVDEQPNSLSGASGVGGNNKYFGVFQVNGTLPQYTAVYNYNGNPFVTPAIESQLRLNKRSDNAAAGWTTLGAVPDEPNNTITVTGESTEYILGRLGGALPVKLISFTGLKQNDNVLLHWKTANEMNINMFEIERSENGSDFITIGTVTSGRADYSFPDLNIFINRTVIYYRLKAIDKDGKFSKSGILKLSKQESGQIALFPNPVKDIVTVSGLKPKGILMLYDVEGKLLLQQMVTTQSVIMDLSGYAKGMYLLQYENEGLRNVHKLMKQ